MTATSGTPNNSSDRQRVIQEPRWSKPGLLRAGNALEVILSQQAGKPAGGMLRALEKSFILEPAAEPELTRDGKHIRASMRPGPRILPGLYDLELDMSNAGPLREPNCVWVVPEQAPHDFMFAHLSDLHLVSPSKKAPQDRTRDIINLMDHLRDHVRPDFILNTGDMVSRYGIEGMPLPQEEVIRQIRAIRELLPRYRIPHFITPGNHDVAFPFIRKEWKQCMGGYWSSHTDDYAFDYGSARFIALDRSVAYDESHHMLDNHLRPGQLPWLREQLAGCADRPIFLFCHYDYSLELNPVLKEHRNIMLLYGHTNTPSVPEDLMIQDSGLRSPYAYRMFRVAANRVERVLGEKWDYFAPAQEEEQS